MNFSLKYGLIFPLIINGPIKLYLLKNTIRDSKTPTFLVINDIKLVHKKSVTVLHLKEQLLFYFLKKVQ